MIFSNSEHKDAVENFLYLSLSTEGLIPPRCKNTSRWDLSQDHSEPIIPQHEIGIIKNERLITTVKMITSGVAW